VVCCVLRRLIASCTVLLRVLAFLRCCCCVCWAVFFCRWLTSCTCWSGGECSQRTSSSRRTKMMQTSRCGAATLPLGGLGVCRACFQLSRVLTCLLPFICFFLLFVRTQVADFGFSRMIQARDVATTPCGTLTYMAPGVSVCLPAVCPAVLHACTCSFSPRGHLSGGVVILWQRSSGKRGMVPRWTAGAWAACFTSCCAASSRFVGTEP